MLKAFKYRLYPDKEQAEKIDKNIGCVRWIYNYALAKKMKAWQQDKKNLSRYDISKDLPILKKQEETKWLKEADSKALMFSLLNLDNAYKKFFKEHKGYPKFKSKKKSRLSYTTYHCIEVNWDKQKLTIAKNKDIKIKLHRKFEGEARQITISKTPTNKYFASVLVETKDKEKKKRKITEKTAIGIDLGIKTFITISDGRKIDNPRVLYRFEKKLAKEQKRLSKKKKGSNNKNKQRIKVAKIHERITDIRKDFLHKLSTELTHENQVKSIIIEDLNVRGMFKNRKLSKAIANVSWSKFIGLLAYKCDWYGVNLLKIGRFEPSSKLCSKCGIINQELTLSDREWTCKNCGTKHDRDINAAINIKRFGLNPKIRQGLSKSKSVERA